MSLTQRAKGHWWNRHRSLTVNSDVSLIRKVSYHTFYIYSDYEESPCRLIVYHAILFRWKQNFASTYLALLLVACVEGYDYWKQSSHYGKPEKENCQWNATIPPIKLVVTFAKTERPLPPQYLQGRRPPISTWFVTLSPGQVFVYTRLVSFKRDAYYLWLFVAERNCMCWSDLTLYAQTDCTENLMLLTPCTLSCSPYEPTNALIKVQ